MSGVHSLAVLAGIRALQSLKYQVGHRYIVHVFTRTGCALTRSVRNYWILAPLQSVSYRLVIVTQCMCALATGVPTLAALVPVLNYWILAPIHNTKCEVQVGHRYTVHMCASMGVPHPLVSELLDPSNVTQYYVQVGHRYTVHVCARNGCILARSGSEILEISVSIAAAFNIDATALKIWPETNFWTGCPTAN